MERIQFNDNEKYIKKYSLNNDNETIKSLDISPLEVDAIAEMLIDQFGHGEKDSRLFYCKVANYIPRGRIDQIKTQAKEKGRNPGALFNYLARKEMGILDG